MEDVCCTSDCAVTGDEIVEHGHPSKRMLICHVGEEEYEE